MSIPQQPHGAAAPRTRPWWRRFWPGGDPAEARRALIARRLYDTIVEKARTPAFYRSLGVPDTTEGRFEMVALHAALVMYRLKQEGAAGRELSQTLFDLMFEDVDENLREIGVGDLSVGKYVKRFAQQFYARLDAVERALSEDDPARLARFLEANLYQGGEMATEPARHGMVDYIFAAAGSLARVSGEDLLAGDLDAALLPAPDVREACSPAKAVDRQMPSD